MKYKSKIDWWYHIGLLILAGVVLYMVTGAVYMKGNMTFVVGAVFFGSVFFLFFLPSYLLTVYTFQKEYLEIRRGFFFVRKIPYDKISAYRKGSAQCDTAALSKDQVLITYRDTKNRRKQILVSPKEQFDFLTQIKLKKEKNEEK